MIGIPSSTSPSVSAIAVATKGCQSRSPGRDLQHMGRPDHEECPIAAQFLERFPQRGVQLWRVADSLPRLADNRRTREPILEQVSRMFQPCVRAAVMTVRRLASSRVPRMEWEQLEM